MNRTQKILGSVIVSLLFISMTMLPMCGVSLQRLDPGMDDMSMMDETDGEYQDDLLSNMEPIDGETGLAEADGFSEADFSEADANATADDSFENQDLVGDASTANDENNADAAWNDDGWGDDGWGDDSWDEASTTAESDAQSNMTESDDFGDDSDSFDDGSDQFVMTEANNTQQTDSESWITPELMESLQKEIEDLEKIADAKNKTADSLRQVKRVTKDENLSTDNIAAKNIHTSDIDDSDFMDSASLDSEFADASDVTQPKREYSTVAADGSNTAIEIAYDRARNAMIDRNYSDAINQFRIMLFESNAGNLADNCQYWIGEAYFARGEYLKAIIEFEKINIFPESNKSADAQLMLGIALMKIGENEDAEREFTDIITMSSNSLAAQKASRYLTELPKA